MRDKIILIMSLIVGFSLFLIPSFAIEIKNIERWNQVYIDSEPDFNIMLTSFSNIERNGSCVEMTDWDGYFSAIGNNTTYTNKYIGVSGNVSLSAGWLAYRKLDETGEQNITSWTYKDNYTWNGEYYEHVYWYKFDSIPNNTEREFRFKICFNERPKFFVLYFGSGSTAIKVSDSASVVNINTGAGGLLVGIEKQHGGIFNESGAWGFVPATNQTDQYWGKRGTNSDDGWGWRNYDSGNGVPQLGKRIVTNANCSIIEQSNFKVVMRCNRTNEDSNFTFYDNRSYVDYCSYANSKTDYQNFEFLTFGDNPIINAESYINNTDLTMDSSQNYVFQTNSGLAGSKGWLGYGKEGRHYILYDLFNYSYIDHAQKFYIVDKGSESGDAVVGLADDDNGAQWGITPRAEPFCQRIGFLDISTFANGTVNTSYNQWGYINKMYDAYWNDLTVSTINGTVVKDKGARVTLTLNNSQQGQIKVSNSSDTTYQKEFFLETSMISVSDKQYIYLYNTTDGSLDVNDYFGRLVRLGGKWYFLNKNDTNLGEYEVGMYDNGTHAKFQIFYKFGSDVDLYIGTTDKFGATQNFTDWWNATWEYKKQLNITNNDPNVLKKYHTINFTLNTTGMNCDALRIVYANTVNLNMTIHNSTLDFISYASGCGASNTTIYFMLQKDIQPSSTDSDYYIYYGNTSPVEKYPNDMFRVFLIYDDFNRADNTSIGNGWTEPPCYGTPDMHISNGQLAPQQNNICADRKFDVGAISDLTGWELFASDYQNSIDGSTIIALRNVSSDSYTGFDDFFQHMGILLFNSYEPAGNGDIFILASKQTTGWVTSEIKKNDWGVPNGNYLNERVVKYDNDGHFGMWVNTTNSFTKNFQMTWNVTNNTYTTSDTNYGIIWFDNRAPSRLDNLMLRRYINTSPSFALSSEQSQFPPTPPTWQNQNQSSNTISYTGNNTLSVQWNDDVKLDWGWLATNETGSWQNKTTYGSPFNLSDGGTSDWSNFTWQNTSMISGGVIAWKVFANDTSGSENVTDVMTFILFSQVTNITDCSVLDQTGVTYYLMADIINDSASVCFDIQADNIILDCQGHLVDGITGGGTYGVYSNSYQNMTIKNCVLTNWDDGIRLDSVTGATMSNIDANNNGVGGGGIAGILVNSGNQIYINDSTTSNNGGGQGIDVWNCQYVYINNVTANSNSYTGIKYEDSHDGSIINSVSNSNGEAGVFIGGSGCGNISVDNVNATTISGWGGFDLGYSSFDDYCSNVYVASSNFDNAKIYKTDNITITFSNITDALYLKTVSNGSFYNNYFNFDNVTFEGDTNPNKWNTTYQEGTNIWNSSLGYIGGNYWYGYSNGCDDLDSDGFCDTPLSLITDNIDYLPLASPLSFTPITDCQEISSSGYYVLQNSITDYASELCFLISSSDVSLDCGGYTVDSDVSNGFYGIYVSGSLSNINITNCVLSDWDVNGIYLGDGDDANLLIENITIFNVAEGVYVLNPLGMTVKNVNISSTYDDFYFYVTDSSYCDNVILENVIGSTGKQIKVYNSSTTTVENEDLDGITLCNADNSYFKNITITNSKSTNQVCDSDNSTFVDSIIANAQTNIWLIRSTGGFINSTIANGSTYNFYFYASNSADCNYYLENVVGTDGLPIYFFNTSTTLSNEAVDEIELCNADNSNLTNITGHIIINQYVDNSIFDSISLTGYSEAWKFYNRISTNNNVSNSIISGGLWGIYLSGSSGYNIYNNFFNNSAYNIRSFTSTGKLNTTRQSGTRIYSNGTEIGGNYWANPSGTGYSETCTDADQDGFCDSSYSISFGTDYLSLSNQYYSPSFISMTLNFTSIGFGLLSSNTINNPADNNYSITLNSSSCDGRLTFNETQPLAYSGHSFTTDSMKLNYTQNAEEKSDLLTLDISRILNVSNSDIIYPQYYLDVPLNQYEGSYSTNHTIAVDCA